MKEAFKRDKYVAAWVSEAEREMVRRLAQQLNFSSISALIRYLLFDLAEQLSKRDDNTPRLS